MSANDTGPGSRPDREPDRLGFGAASIGNLYRAVTDREAGQVLAAAWAGGMRTFDTAPHYGLGLSERRLGAFLSRQPRADFRVSTKVGRVLVDNPDHCGGDDLANGFAVPDTRRRVFDPSRDGVRRSLDDSLRRLGLHRVDTLLLHDPDVYDLESGLRQGLPALAELREEGLVDEIGIGVNSAEVAARAVREADLDVVMIAGRYTLLEQPALAELLPLCAERGVRVIAVGVFNSGVLAATDPAQAHYDYGSVPAELFARTERLRAVCAGFGVPLAAAALRYPLRHPAVSQVLVGTANVAELQQNLAHFRRPIPEELWTTLREQSLIP